MVDVLDNKGNPIINPNDSSKNLSYHIDPNLLKKWDKLKHGKLTKHDSDRVYIVDGRERVGKSLFAFQQAKYIDPDFNIDRICFSPEEFLNQIRNAPQNSVIIFDEAFRGLSSKSSQSKVNKKIVQAMMEMGQRNLIVFIVLPTIFLLEIYPAVLRSECLFHIYKDKNGRRLFRIYNYQKKSQLYQVGKKKGFSYSFPKSKIRGKFFGIYPIEEAGYRKKKLESLREIEVLKEDDKFDARAEKFMEYAKILKELVSKHKNIKEASKEIIAAGIDRDYTTIHKDIIRLRKEEARNVPKVLAIEQ